MMTESDIHDTSPASLRSETAAPPISERSEATERVYPMSRQGRRQALIFFLGNDDTAVKNEADLEAGAQAEDTAPLPPEPETARVQTSLAADPPEGAGDAEGEDEAQTLLLRTRHDHTNQIANPAIRFLHK